MRGKIKQEIVEYAEKVKKPILLEAKFNTLSNNAFHSISQKVKEENESIDAEKVFSEWKKWMEETAERF